MEDKPKKVVIISSKEIEKNNFRCFTSLYKNGEHPLIFYSSIDPSFIRSNENTSYFKNLSKRYLICEAKDIDFYIWVNPDDEEIIKNSITTLQNCFNGSKKSQQDDEFSNDIILLLYFLFDERILQNNFSYYYKIIIKALVEIFIKTSSPPKGNSQFSFNGVWDQFFNWLHEIEPSVLYSFFLRQCISSICRNTASFDSIIKSGLKMPSIYFTPYFLKKLPELEFTISKTYCSKMDKIILDTPEIYIISIFPFYSGSNNSFKKKSKNFEEIIKDRINQSSYASELTIACFREQVKSLKVNIPNLKENSLAIEPIKSQNEQPYFQVIPEQDENFVYYGLPCQIRLQTNQDYYNFYEKKIFINYPLQLIEDPRSSFQNRKISNYFQLNKENEDKIKFLIPDAKTYETFMNFRGSSLFKLLLQKYTNNKVPFQFQRQNDADEIQVIGAFQSIFNRNKCIEIYKRPLTLDKCSKELVQYLKQKPEPKPELKPEPKQSQSKNKKINKKKIVDKPKPTINENPFFFITMSDSPFFIIDSVSNFINAKFDDYLKSFSNQTECSLEFFDIEYIKKALYNDNNGSENNALNRLNDMHLENIIKMSLFSALYYNFHSVFDNHLSKFRLLPLQHFLFLFIFYKVETQNSTFNQTILKAFNHIQQMTEVKVEMLSKLYFCYQKKNEIIELNMKSQFIYPPPFMFTILDQFLNEFEKKISYKKLNGGSTKS